MFIIKIVCIYYTQNNFYLWLSMESPPPITSIPQFKYYYNSLYKYCKYIIFIVVNIFLFYMNNCKKLKVSKYFKVVRHPQKNLTMKKMYNYITISEKLFSRGNKV